MTLVFSFFETTIRYLGSMLSAYELNGYRDAALLANAQRLADKLIFGWVPANGPIPFVFTFLLPTHPSDAVNLDTGASIFPGILQTLARVR
jgi:hypothetical protein